MDRQVPLFGIRVQEVEHDGRNNEENKAAHLQEKTLNQSIKSANYGFNLQLLGSCCPSENTAVLLFSFPKIYRVEGLDHMLRVSVVVFTPVDFRTLVGENSCHPLTRVNTWQAEGKQCPLTWLLRTHLHFSVDRWRCLYRWFMEITSHSTLQPNADHRFISVSHCVWKLLE